jgi:hypothetical protein
MKATSSARRRPHRPCSRVCQASIAPVRATLNQLREVVRSQARDLPGVLAEIRDVQLPRVVRADSASIRTHAKSRAVKLALAGMPLLPSGTVPRRVPGELAVGVAARSLPGKDSRRWIAESLRRAGARRSVPADSAAGREAAEDVAYDEPQRAGIHQNCQLRQLSTRQDWRTRRRSANDEREAEGRRERLSTR